jgi:hypothetical protein
MSPGTIGSPAPSPDTTASPGATPSAPVPASPGVPARSSAPAAPSAAVKAKSLAAAKAQCFGGGFTKGGGDAAAAKALMAGRITLYPHAAARLPANPTWKENPFKDPNWVFQLHTLRWADVLRREGIRTKNNAMLNRHMALLSDWVKNNPRKGAPSSYSWSEMATGIRAIAFSCAIASYGYKSGLVMALNTHGGALVNPNFGAQTGNHALHARLGLLVAGCVVPNPAWVRTARSRIDSLLRGSVDAEGVIDEGSTTYALSNYGWYSDAKTRIQACRIAPGPSFARLALMPEFFAHATTPERVYDQIGDSDRTASSPITTSPHALYAATGGVKGTAPAAVYTTYQRGYVFGRSGWGTSRPFADELFYGLRFGPSLDSQMHGHEDAGALTLNADGRRLLFDSGRYKYDASDLTRYMRSRAAHNTVDVLGARYDRSAKTTLLTSKHTTGYDLTTVRVTALTGTTWDRTVFYSRTGRYLVVDDALVNKGGATMVQRWNLPENGTQTVGASSMSIDGPGADLSMFWVGAPPTLSVTSGRTSPLLGWRSYKFGQAFAAPVAEAATTGSTGRFTTILVPRPDTGLDATVTDSSVVDGSADMTVTVGARSERVHLTATEATVTPL